MIYIPNGLAEVAPEGWQSLRRPSGSSDGHGTPLITADCGVAESWSLSMMKEPATMIMAISIKTLKEGIARLVRLTLNKSTSIPYHTDSAIASPLVWMLGIAQNTYAYA